MAPKAGKAKPKAKGDKKKKEEKGVALNPLVLSCEGIVLGVSKWFSQGSFSEREANTVPCADNCELLMEETVQFGNNLLFADFVAFFFFFCVRDM